MLHHREIYIEFTYRILTMPVCTQLRDILCNAEQGFRLVKTGLQLQAGNGSFPSSPSHSTEKLPHMTYFLVLGGGTQAWITRLHCTCRAICASSESGKSTSGGGEACGPAFDGGGWPSGGLSRYSEYVETGCILNGHVATRVLDWLPWCWHC